MSGTLLPGWARRTAAWCAVALLVAAVGWLALSLLAQVRLVAVAAVAAVLLAAALDPVARRLRWAGAPRWLAALTGVLLLLALPATVGVLVWSRSSGQLPQLEGALTAAVDRIRRLLVSEPVSLDPGQVDRARDVVVGRLADAVPDPAAGATMVLEALSGVVLAGFVLFFLLKDGRRLWWWTVAAAPSRHRARVAASGAEAWATLSSYAVGIAAVALADAAGIGLALFVLGVPLALSLTVLVFLGGFVPYLGATVSGSVAVLVTLVTEGGAAAVIVLGVVLVVQLLEGYVLHPLIVGRAVDVHPVVILLAVSAGALLGGIIGAVVAVPLVAVTHRVAAYLRTGHRTTIAT